MGLSGIAKAPVSHGVEPHDLETGGLALASALAFRPYRSSLSPPLPRERFSARVESRQLDPRFCSNRLGARSGRFRFPAKCRLSCPASNAGLGPTKPGQIGQFRVNSRWLRAPATTDS